MAFRFNRKKFFDLDRTKFGNLSQGQVNGINNLLTSFESDPHVTDVRWFAYMLATVKHETANTFMPIEEYGKGRGHSYGQPVNGHTYYGRGYVQLTWEKNYANMGKILGIDLVKHPELALNPRYAYQIMSYGMIHGSFTGRRLAQYIHGNVANYYAARQIINGLDRALLIAGYATKFEAILRGSME
jgi:Chitinase class I